MICFLRSDFVKKGKFIFLFLFLSLLFLQASCSSHREPSVAYSLEGPQLFVRGTVNNEAVEGRMDRSAMVGLGEIRLLSTYYDYDDQRLNCVAVLNSPPTDKGRVRGVLDCTGSNNIFFTLRNLGPDQGVGIGQSYEDDAELLIFYHSSDEEAQRRLPEVTEDIRKAREAALNN